jgi:hypothetical protein
MRTKMYALIVTAFAALLAVFVSSPWTPSTANVPIPDPVITIGPVVPGDIQPGAQSANIKQAAAFAWREFIALNWPALAGKRDTPDGKCGFTDPACANQPRVWETFRSKIEIFPNTGTPNGYSPTAPDYGYDAPPPPEYNLYLVNAPACPTQTKPAQAAWINLDETDQITIDQMYSGAGPSSPSSINAQPQLVRFLAKGNRTEYKYVAQSKWFQAIPRKIRTDTLAFLKNNKADPPPGSTNLVSLPNNTIEIKAGWRRLTAGEAQSGRYFKSRVRYYETPNGGNPCYHEVPNALHQDWFGLVALHIIQKTMSAPYFVYATFEQADNIVAPGADPNGTPVPVEKDDGAPNVTPACPPGQTAPCPTSPLELLIDGPSPSPSSMYPPQIVLQTPPPDPQYCGALTGTRPINRLYYLNQNPPPPPTYQPNPAGGFICVVQRRFPIPREIIAVNDVAQKAIRAYPNGSASPWSHYKLVNVQYRPYSNDVPGVPFPGHDPTTGNNQPNFYLANIVVETNRSLQQFQGGLLGGIVQADYAARFGTGETGSHKNMVYNKAAYDMGGCMGCHGSQGQSSAGNFSVILARAGAQNLAPEGPHPVGVTLSKSVQRLRYNRVLVSH